MSFIVSVILARLITPEDFGVVALVSVFISLCDILTDGGFGMALIQKKNADDLDFSSVFYVNIGICTTLYGILFVCSPLIADFYEIQELTIIVRVQSLTLLFSGVKTMYVAYVSRNMLFKRYFIATFGATVLSAIVGIAMAYAGFGIWAIVTQSLVNNIVGTIILSVTVKWRPKKMFSFLRIKTLFFYGSKILFGNLINTGYNDLRQIIIGKGYTASELAYFNRGAKLPSMVDQVISTGISSILLPTMSQCQDSLTNIRNIVKRSITVSSYILFPLFVGLAVCSESIIRLLFTDIWIEAAEYLPFFCGMYIFNSIGVSNLDALKALGFPGKVLVIQGAKTILYTIILVITMPFGVKAIAIGSMVGCLFGMFLCIIPGKKAFGYSLFQQFKDIFPHIGLSILVGCVIMLLSLIPLSDFWMLILQMTVGASVYVALSAILKLESFYYVKNLLFSIIHDCQTK